MPPLDGGRRERLLDLYQRLLDLHDRADGAVTALAGDEGGKLQAEIHDLSRAALTVRNGLLGQICETAPFRRIPSASKP